MKINELVRELQGQKGQDSNFIKSIFESMLQEAIRIEFDNFIGAEKHERTSERKGLRNGSYERQLNTRVGSITLNICRDRDGEFSPSLFEKYERSEKALVATIAEMYFSGVSTRKVKGAMEALCGMKVSKSQVSDAVKKLDANLLDWRNRPLISVYVYLMFDARYEKVRENGRVVSKAFVVVIGITADGIREIIGCFVINSESYEEWNDCIQKLVNRGLTGVKYAVSDENAGLKRALEKHFQNIPLQRCQVHYMRNLMSKVSKSNQSEAVQLMKDVFAAPERKEAIERSKKLAEFLISKKQNVVADWIEETVEETLAVYELPKEIHKQLKSTNMLERLNQELKRRSRCVRIFPNVESCIRLLGTLCMETSEEWSYKKYLKI